MSMTRVRGISPWMFPAFGWGDTMMNGTNLWMLHKWNGRMMLSCQHSEAYFSETQISGILERIRYELRSGLGLL